VLLLLAIAVPLFIAVRASISRRGVEVNHVFLFTLGYLLYWILPIALGRLRILEAHPALRLWYDFYDAGSRHDSFATYLVFCLLMYLAFVLGSAVGARLRLYRRGVGAGWSFDHRLLYAYLAAGVLLTSAYAWKLRADLFTGYQAVYGPQASARGTLTACSLLLLGLFLIHLAHPDQRRARQLGAVSVVSDAFLLAYSASAVLLLGLGGRLYVVSAVLIILTYWTVYRGRMGYLRAAAITVGVMAAAGAVGLLRLKLSVSTLSVAANLFSEPLFTSFSLFAFLAEGDLPLLQFPRFLLSDFLNLVPSALLPGKALLLVNPEHYGFVIFSPLGALTSFVSFMINFGFIGSLLTLFGLGAGLAVLRRMAAPVAHVSYAMLSGWLAFSFFRDPFSVSVVKSMVQFSVLVPWGIVASLHIVSVAARGSRVAAVHRHAPLPTGPDHVTP